VHAAAVRVARSADGVGGLAVGLGIPLADVYLEFLAGWRPDPPGRARLSVNGVRRPGRLAVKRCIVTDHDELAI
jgi:hypothetical protein